MQDAVPSITLDVSAASMPHVLTRITAFLLQHEYAFFQTFKHAQPTVISIFLSAPQLGLYLSLRSIDSETPGPVIHALARDDNLPSETASLLQRLLEVCDPSGDVQ